jgi:hypothetical protein
MNRKTRRKTARKSLRVPKERTGSCWKGYHRIKGTMPYSKHSCAKNGQKMSFL